MSEGEIGMENLENEGKVGKKLFVKLKLILLFTL